MAAPKSMVTAMALSVALALARPGAAQQGLTAQDAERGRALFLGAGCSECHGTVGQGGPGVRIAPSPLPAVVIGAYIRNPAGVMPPYTSKLLSDADVCDIHAYLASVAPPPALGDIPALAR